MLLHPALPCTYGLQRLCVAFLCCSCSLHPNFIELQLLPFGMPLSHTVSLVNEGTVPARFYFVSPPKPRMSVDGKMWWDDNQPVCPPWLIIQPDEGEVAPGVFGGWGFGFAFRLQLDGAM
jgi:hypothetical protein